MPLAQLYFAGGSLTKEKKSDLGRKLTDFLSQETGIPKGSFSIQIMELDPDCWISGGETITEVRAKRAAAAKKDS